MFLPSGPRQHTCSPGVVVELKCSFWEGQRAAHHNNLLIIKACINNSVLAREKWMDSGYVFKMIKSCFNVFLICGIYIPHCRYLLKMKPISKICVNKKRNWAVQQLTVWAKLHLQQDSDPRHGRTSTTKWLKEKYQGDTINQSPDLAEKLWCPNFNKRREYCKRTDETETHQKRRLLWLLDHVVYFVLCSCCHIWRVFNLFVCISSASLRSAQEEYQRNALGAFQRFVQSLSRFFIYIWAN